MMLKKMKLCLDLSRWDRAAFIVSAVIPCCATSNNFMGKQAFFKDITRVFVPFFSDFFIGSIGSLRRKISIFPKVVPGKSSGSAWLKAFLSPLQSHKTAFHWCWRIFCYFLFLNFKYEIAHFWWKAQYFKQREHWLFVITWSKTKMYEKPQK